MIFVRKMDEFFRSKDQSRLTSIKNRNTNKILRILYCIVKRLTAFHMHKTNKTKCNALTIAYFITSSEIPPI